MRETKKPKEEEEKKKKHKQKGERKTRSGAPSASDGEFAPTPARALIVQLRVGAVEVRFSRAETRRRKPFRYSRRWCLRPWRKP